MFMAGVTVAGVLWAGSLRSGRSGNLALKKGVIATCDSTEKEELSPYMAIDGNDEDLSSRWSSENNWEDSSHYIELEFPEEISVSFVVLKWERRNVISYALEGSLNGTDWETLKSFETAPENKRQEIVLEEAVSVKYLRLSTYAVSKEEKDYSNLYQNVSLYEFEVYADKPAAYRLEEPGIEIREDGSRHLVLPKAPKGYTVSLIGADYEQVIGVDGTIYDTIQDKEVTVGFLVSDERGKEEEEEAQFVVKVPAYGYDSEQPEEVEEAELAEGEEIPVNECPKVIPALAEWRGGSGEFTISPDTRIIVDGRRNSNSVSDGEAEKPESDGETADGEAEKPESDGEAADAAMQAAELFADRYEQIIHNMYGETTLEGSKWSRLEVCGGTLEDVQPGDIYLGYAEEGSGLGEEGYTCDITDKCVIRAETVTGLRWGMVTLLQILSESAVTVPQGMIRDYPLYEVRGFGIDVARKAVSLTTLYSMMETMSWYKMNDLSIHLNDNTILSTSGLTGSVAQAMTADSAFRLESDVENSEGERLTSEEYFYTKKEFAAFIENAAVYGVDVVPEIDTPAHSLSLTKLFPEYALTTANESVDQIDLSNGQARELVEDIWTEALEGEDAPFANAATVNIGMDEYYGDGEEYRQFAVQINELVQEEGKTVRMWGSLSNIDGTLMPPPDNLQMNLWSTVWADPVEMYEAGYSLINMQNNHLYIIPGGGYDYLDVKELYENWQPNKFYDYNQLETIPSYSPQMLGAAYMIWNDMSGNLDIGISEYDLYDRFRHALTVLSGKLWGMEEGVSYDDYRKLTEDKEWRRIQTTDSSGREKQLLYDTAVGIEPPYEIYMMVYLNEGDTPQEQILAEGDSAYGKWAFYAVEPETGKVGFSREGKTYVFDYTLPRGEWVQLNIGGSMGRIWLSVNSKKVDELGSGEPFEEYATFVFPTQRVGEATGSFDGEMEMEYMRWGRYGWPE